jgi:predicted transcriptional regulator
MAENLSLKLKDEVFKKTEEIVDRLDVSRNAYINDAVEFYNAMMERKLTRARLVKESKAVYRTSLDVLQEFERLEDDLPE